MATITVAAPTGGDDQSLLQGAINNATAGDTLVFPSGSIYKHSAKIIVQNKAGLTFRAGGSDQFTWQATTPGKAAFHIWTNANGTTVQGLKHQVIGATTRIDQGFDVAPFVVDYASGVTLTDCISQGSAGLGIYLFRSLDGNFTRFQVLQSGADAIHHTYGAARNTWTDPFVNGCGDDGFANIGYGVDGEAGRPHHNTALRLVVLDCHARGISFAGAYDCSVTTPDINGTRATGVLFARENGADFKTMATERCFVSGGKIRRTQTPKAALGSSAADGAVHTGAILFDAGATNGIVDCYVDGTSIGNLASGSSSVGQSSNSTALPGCSVTNLKLYAGAPTTAWNGSAPTTSGWQDLRTQTMAASATTPATSSGGGTTTPATRSAMPTGLLRHWNAQSLGGLADGAAVTSWVDAVAGASLTKAATTAPTRTSVAGKTAVRFNGNDQDLRQANPLAASQAYTVVAVVSTTNATREQQVTWQGAGADLSVYQGKWSAYADQVLTTTQAPVVGATTVLTTIFSGSSSAVYVNGSTGASGNVGAGAANGALLLVGNHPNLSRFWGGEMYELRLYDHALTAVERQAVHSYAQDNYPLAAADYAPAATTTTGVRVRKSGAWVAARVRKSGAWVTGPKARRNGAWT